MDVELKEPDSVGWVSKMGVEDEEYAWSVRCPKHPPEQRHGWEEIAVKDVPLMLSPCEVCGENLV